MSDQDWAPVVIRKKTPKPTSNEDALRMARQDGVSVETVKKCIKEKHSN